MFLVSSEIGCWASPSIGRVAGLGCDDVGLERFGIEVHITLGKGLMCSLESEGLGGFNACVFVVAIAYVEGGVSVV